MTTHRHTSRRTKQLAPTQPEIRAQPLAEKPAGPDPLEKRQAAPNGRKSQRGRYAVHEERGPAVDAAALVKGLSSGSTEAKLRASKMLKAYATDAEKARDVVSLLPPDSPTNRLIAAVRAHCIEIIRREIR